MQMKHKTLLQGLWAFVTALALSGTAAAQSFPAKGSVHTEDNEPLIGVVVMEDGTSNAVSTDADGKFSINVGNGATLKFSMVGFRTLTMKASGEMNVILQEDIELLDELVVTGYSVQRKADLTGSITVVSVEDIKNSPNVDVMTALQGRVPGMAISATGDPSSQASIKIRGIGTMNNTDPLYIVDGVPTTQGIKDINASDIESIQVLKDAASASIYGSRAANGVIIITTNKGKDGKVKLNFNASVQIQDYSRKIDLCNTEELGEVIYRAFTNENLDPNTNALGYKFDANGKMVKTSLLGTSTNMIPADTDWWDEITQTAIRQTYELTMSNGNKNGNYYLSLGYTDGDGIVKNSDYTRYNARINSNYKLFKGIINIGENLTISRTSEAGLADNYGSSGNVLQIATQALSIIPVHTVDGGWGGPVDGMCDRMNPARIVDAARNNSNNSWRIFGSIFMDIHPMKNLVIRTSFGPEYSTRSSRSFRYPYKEGFLSSNELSTSITQNERTNWTWTNTATYNLEIGKHRATFLIGNEMISNDTVTVFQKSQGYEIDSPNYMWPDAATGAANVSGNEVKSTLSSFFAKIDYSFNNKYILGLTVRRDGSSKFGKDKQFATFPSVSLGWRLSQEPWMQKISWLNDLKIRGSWGTNGNQSIANGAIYSLYDTLYGTASNPTWGNFDGSSYDIKGADSGSLASGYRRTQQGNSVLKWETSEQYDLGVDFSFFKGALYGQFDWFFKKTKDILIKPNVIGAAGEGASRYENGASMENKGLEFQIGYKGRTNFGLLYDVSGNISTYRNKVTYLPESVLAQYGGNGTTDTILGRCLGSYYGYKENGLYRTEAEVAAGPEHAGKGLGRIKWVDLNHDGKINEADRTWIGAPQPDFSWGLNIALSYKNFDLSMFWEGKQGWMALTPTKSQTDFFAVAAEGTNRGKDLLKAWTPTNSKSKIPAITYTNANDEGRTSTYLYEDHSFAKLRNLQLGYTCRAAFLRKAMLEKVRIYATAQNLIQITGKDFTGTDVEMSGFSYPLPTTFTFGLQLSF